MVLILFIGVWFFMVDMIEYILLFINIGKIWLFFICKVCNYLNVDKVCKFRNDLSGFVLLYGKCIFVINVLYFYFF